MKVGDALGMSRDPVPAGVYALEVLESEDLENPSIKDNTQGGRQISFLSTVIDNPEFEGKGIWQNFNIVKPGLFYFASFLTQTGFCEESQDMGDPYSEDEFFQDFLASLIGHRFMAEVTCELVYSKKQQKEVEVNKVINLWPYEEVGAGVPEKAKEILGPKPSAKAPVKPELPAKPGPSKAAPPARKAPPKRDLPTWAQGGESGDTRTRLQKNPI